jgi:uncharacterized protein YdhG (YjbR/CyaY superfamily)
MVKSEIKSVTDYIASQPAAARAALRRARSTIRKAMPRAEEVISYGIPAYRLQGRVVIYFAAWKEHYSIYPATDGLAEAFKDELAAYEVSKGTIRLPLSEPVPVKLIERVAKFRVKQAAAREKAKLARNKKR